MNKVFKILFIDDDFVEGNPEAVNRNDILVVMRDTEKLNIIGLHPSDFEKQLDKDKSLNLNDFHLVIVDYELKSTMFENEKYHGNGRTVAAKIREEAPLLPIYLVSRSFDHNFNNSDVFEKVLTHDFITKKEGREMLESDSQDFQQILSDDDKGGLERAIELLKVPKDSVESIRLALPHEFRKSIYRDENKEANKIGYRKPLKFARWVLGVLLENSGPLCSSQEAAQILGLDEDYFKNQFIKAHRTIERCIYSGVFNNQNNCLWWRDSLFSWVAELLSPKGYGGELPWTVLPKLLRISKKNHSECVVCGKTMPDCLALDEELGDRSVKFMAHWACSKIAEDIHPDFGFKEFYYCLRND